jgi:putative transposase
LLARRSLKGEGGSLSGLEGNADSHKGCPYRACKINNVGTGLACPPKPERRRRVPVRKAMKQKQLPQRKSTRVKGHDYSSERAYFITICTKDKNEYFKDKVLADKIISSLRAYKDKLKFGVYVYCLMPDHLHLLINPADSGKSIPVIIGGFKSITTRIAWAKGIKGKLWQSRYYDHVLRKNEDLLSVGTYIINNPVRKGIVDKWQDYRHCGIIDKW